ncbi:MAG: CBS domain-containing protein [Chloroflexi bacterium]|nr:CBS domain-containing protein [Chloroflexota bacterium]
MIVILSHSNSDFDAVAAQLAAARLYGGAVALLARQLTDSVDEYLALHAEQLPFVSQLADDAPISRVILVDTARLPAAFARTPPLPTTIIDHHHLERDLAPHEDAIIEDVGATTTMLVRRLIDAGATLSPIEATLLLLGIYADTDCLTVPATREADVACAAWLLRQGARITAIGEYIRRPLSQGQERAFHQLEQQLVVEEIRGWSVALAWAELTGPIPEVSPLAHRLRDLYAPAVVILACGIAGSGTQIVVRSDARALDAGMLAQQFGGGGHPAAAAAFVADRAAAAVCDEIRARLDALIEPALTAADLMTRRVHSAPIDASVAQAAELMTRYGHGALPVIDAAGRPRGMIVRRDLDHARRHGLHDAPLERYLWHGPPTITGDATLGEVRRALAAEGRRIDDGGRILVVDADGVLCGIITRADVLRALEYGRPGDTNGHADAAEALEAWLDPTRLALIREAGRIAEAHQRTLHVVGGSVRDMLLGRPCADLDLVVEGDAIGLAHDLADAWRGSVRSHPQFGTATLELTRLPACVGARAGELIAPLSLDFVMARSEFYERPSALPDVEAASLRHDLHRRDFTINTLAICLNPTRYGRLYDFFGGRGDIQRGIIRVLHNLSFIDDPTRILRAARLAGRLGFVIEPRTASLIDDALEHEIFRRTTPQRIARELCLIFDEAAPEHALKQLAALGVPGRLLAGYRLPDGLGERLERARRAALVDTPPSQVALALCVYGLESSVIADIISTFQPSTAITRLLLDLARLPAICRSLDDATLPPSVVVQRLDDVTPLAVRVAALADDATTVRRHLGDYLERWRHIRPDLDGRAVRELSGASGPAIGAILRGLRAALLDGVVTSEQQQVAWVEAQRPPAV